MSECLDCGLEVTSIDYRDGELRCLVDNYEQITDAKRKLYVSNTLKLENSKF